MHGHLPLIAMRKRGIKPGIVFLNDYPCETSKDWHNPGEEFGESWGLDHATVCTVGDVIQLLDLRFLVGMRVSITSTTEFFAGTYGRMRDLCISPTGKVYICTSNGGNNDKIIEVRKLQYSLFRYRSNTRQHFPFKIFQHGATASRNITYFICKTKLIDGCNRIATAN